MRVETARDAELAGFLGLAAEVEQWFGPMADDPGFRSAVCKHIRRGTALVALAPERPEPVGGLLFGAKPPLYYIRWLVVSEQARGRGVGRALIEAAMRMFVRGPGTVEVVTFGADHPGASASGSRAFYERLGFVPAEASSPGPEGGSRQVYRRAVN